MRPVVLLVALIACGQSTNPVPEAAAARPAQTGEGSAQTVGTWKGGSLTLGEVEARVQGRLDTMEQEYQLQRYELLSQALEGAVDEALLAAEAEARKLPDTRALLAAEVEAKVTLPSDEEVAGFYEEVKGQLRGATLEQAHSMLAGELIQRRMAERYEAFLTELRRQAKVEAAIPYPDLKRIEVAVAPTDPVLGDPSAPVTIVQFAEYQCYYCGKVSPTLRALVEDYDGKVKVVFMDYPLENHKRAAPAAVAARCAGEQGRYWEMNERLLANQGRLEDADFTRYAGDLGLDGAKFDACRTDGEIAARVRASTAEAERVGVQATPTFYVNGLLVSGAQPYDRFKAVIDQELARGR